MGDGENGRRGDDTGRRQQPPCRPKSSARLALNRHLQRVGLEIKRRHKGVSRHKATPATTWWSRSNPWSACLCGYARRQTVPPRRFVSRLVYSFVVEHFSIPITTTAALTTTTNLSLLIFHSSLPSCSSW